MLHEKTAEIFLLSSMLLLYKPEIIDVSQYI